MRGVPIAKLIVAVIILTVITSVIMLIPNWNGEEASTAAPKIDDLLDVMIVLSSFVFSIVLVMLAYSLWRWRVRPGDEGDGAPIHGNTRLEIAWTVIPTVIVLFGAIYSWITLSDIEAHDPNRMAVDVYGQQYEWHFNYPEQGVTSRELHVPVDRQMEFRMHTLDVIHSFWVPEWRIKKDAGPGITTRAYVTPTKAEDRDDEGPGGRGALAGGLRQVGDEPATDPGERPEARRDHTQATEAVSEARTRMRVGMEGWRG